MQIEVAYPAGIVAQGLAVMAGLAAHVAAHRGASLAAHEQGVLALWQAQRAGWVATVIAESTRSLQPGGLPGRVRCPTCGSAVGRPHWLPRSVETVCGRVTVQRPWYRCRAQRGCPGWGPADAVLGLDGDQRVSPTLHTWLSEVGARTDYREGAALLGRLAGITIAAETVRQHTLTAGAVLEAAQQQAQARLADPRTAAEVGSDDPAPGELTVQTDGVRVRYRERDPGVPEDRGWREVKIGVVGGWQPAGTVPARRPTTREHGPAAHPRRAHRRRAPTTRPDRAAPPARSPTGHLVAKSYVAAREAASVFGPRLLAEAARRGALDVVDWAGARLGPGVAELRRVLLLGDGALWIWQLASEHFAERVEILDFYHAAQHLTTVAHLAFGEGTLAATQWAEQHRTMLREQGATPLLAALKALPTPATPTAVQALTTEKAYFRKNATRMAYPTFRTQDLPIGSGAVEGSASHLVGLRLKRPGCRWSRSGAHAVLQVRCALLTQDETRRYRSAA